MSKKAICKHCIHPCKKSPAPECDKFERENSKDYFSFVLNSTIFPIFGIKHFNMCRVPVAFIFQA